MRNEILQATMRKIYYISGTYLTRLGKADAAVWDNSTVRVYSKMGNGNNSKTERKERESKNTTWTYYFKKRICLDMI